jgi:hypothetical protein
MNHHTVVAVLVAVAALSAAPVAAQTLTGTWELSQQTQRGQRTSTLGGRRGGGEGGGGSREVEVEEGMVSGDNFSFSITLRFGGNSVTQEYSGTFDGDSMEGEITGGGRRGGGGPWPFTGTRGS